MFSLYADNDKIFSTIAQIVTILIISHWITYLLFVRLCGP